ncbi:uncharacterized protein LOC135120965, partial [Zophobas morio]|uniref:uncharacterized protein LOC135120965 n=1 Tax=Zophobas morio TaxID=2755281 RepID=UPI003083306E
ISLLIFDECHNAVKAHPYTKVMSHYCQYLKERFPFTFTEDRLLRPRILGLTASPISFKLYQKFDAAALQEQLSLLEHVLCSKIVTIDSEESLKDFVVTPEEHVVWFPSNFASKNEKTAWEVQWRNSVSLAVCSLGRIALDYLGNTSLLTPCALKELERFPMYTKKSQKLKALLLRYSSIKTTDKICQGNDGALSTDQDTPFCGIVFVNQKICALALAKMIKNDPELSSFYRPGVLFGLKDTFHLKCQNTEFDEQKNIIKIEETPNPEANETHSPPFFLLRLPTFDEIKKLASSGPLDKLVTKQNDTKIKVESDNSEDDSNTFTEEENSNIINEQNNTKDSEEANTCAVDDLLCFSVEELLEDAQSMNQFFSLAQQRKTMDLFIKGQVNVLVSTSVAEEGLDVGRCNFVVLYDSAPSFKKYIQARGRARREGGSLFFFQEYFEADQVRPVCPLQHYKKIETCILQKLMSQVSPASYFVDHRGSEFTTKTGIVLRAEEAITCLHRYCATLNTNTHTACSPVYHVTNARGFKSLVDSMRLTGQIDWPECSPSIACNEAVDTFANSFSRGNSNDPPFFCTVQLPGDSPVSFVMPPDSYRGFSSKKRARQETALIACQRLYLAGALDEHLLPMSIQILKNSDLMKSSPLISNQNYRVHIPMFLRFNKKTCPSKLRQEAICQALPQQCSAEGLVRTENSEQNCNVENSELLKAPKFQLELFLYEFNSIGWKGTPASLKFAAKQCCNNLCLLTLGPLNQLIGGHHFPLIGQYEKIKSNKRGLQDCLIHFNFIVWCSYIGQCKKIHGVAALVFAVCAENIVSPLHMSYNGAFWAHYLFKLINY